jgi:hypothetical protein
VPNMRAGLAWDLREMGSSQGKEVREGRAPQAGRKISRQLPARKEATWSRKKKEGWVGHDEEEPGAQSEHLKEGFCNNVIRCNVANVKVNTAFVSGE